MVNLAAHGAGEARALSGLGHMVRAAGAGRGSSSSAGFARAGARRGAAILAKCSKARGIMDRDTVEV